MAKRTKEHCEKVARTCTTIKEFWSKCRSVATKAHKEGWLKSFTWLAREISQKHFRTTEDILEIAGKFRTLKDFREKCPNECRYAWAHGWLEECTWLKRERPGRK